MAAVVDRRVHRLRGVAGGRISCRVRVGVGYADAYRGLSYVADSERAARWTEKVGRAMHEIQIETNVYILEIVCHDLRVDQLASGDPLTGELTTTNRQP